MCAAMTRVDEGRDPRLAVEDGQPGGMGGGRASGEDQHRAIAYVVLPDVEGEWPVEPRTIDQTVGRHAHGRQHVESDRSLHFDGCRGREHRWCRPTEFVTMESAGNS